MNTGRVGFGMVCVVAAVFLFACGCTSTSPDIQKPEITPPGIPGHEGSGAPSLTSIPGTIAKPSKIPATDREEQYENLTVVSETLYSLSEEWDTAGLTCGERSCTGMFVNGAGDTATITTTLYESSDTARLAFESVKSAHSTDRTIPLEYGDDGFAWQHRATSGAVILKANLMVSLEYTVNNGPATIGDAVQVANAIGGNLQGLKGG